MKTLTELKQSVAEIISYLDVYAQSLIGAYDTLSALEELPIMDNNEENGDN